ncbi:MAG TPA: hypothetical protein VFR41_11840 [Acidimicrobiia bacterium]|nr:hypothetical protein [Acidimicrobiia bacterium]
MAEPHHVGGGRSVNDHFFRRYRELLDAEDNAFDELEHAYEDGDRATFEIDLVALQAAISRRASFLEMHGLTVSPLGISLSV